ncbi:pentapeptide repeat-containing protein [Trichocoleus sp. DQ-A3]|uniref:NACHT domain-containing protein n=1 Tax=Cyanophyceae TaxID=3028117 RepID=UPI0016885D06|nr:pentapeptide repeat-containing protein [Coleofasciculus sp. FACHB-125]MBD1899740.1 pentapeptide repeat-containing protein [Coleofasciculus sp. FACHB-125]
MSLSIRHWLAERNIELATLRHPGTQIAGIAFRIVRDMELKSLTPFDISVLAEVLELPLRAAWEVAGVASQLCVGLLRILSQKKPLKRNEGTWLTFQIAYLNALQGILEQESQLRRPWLSRAGVPGESEDLYGQVWDAPLSDPQLQALLKTLRPGRLTDSQAEQALSMVGDSFLVQQMNSTGIAWLIANGAEETEAKLIAQRLVHGLPGYLLAAIAENALPLAQLQKFVQLGNLSTWQDTPGAGNPERKRSGFSTTLNFEPNQNSHLNTPQFSLNLERERYRASLLQSLSEPLLAEPFALKDLYVPLKGVLLEESSTRLETKNPKSDPTTTPLAANAVPAKPVDLMEWVTAQLNDTTSIAAIESLPGTGKTSFCQILASTVAQELYPRWMPAFIRLKDATLGQTLEQTLNSAFPWGRFTDADGWLSPMHPPCLLILDGLDELPRSSHAGRHYHAFLNQLMQFQGEAMASFEGTPRHKIILTSRTTGREGEYFDLASTLIPLPHDLRRRIAIQPMEHEEFREWFKQWSKLQSKAIAQGYFAFVKERGGFSTRPVGTPGAANVLAALVRKPLMLYLLGILHRDGLLNDTIFHLTLPQAKFEIYDRICRWLLAYPEAGSGSMPFVIREGLAHAYRSNDAIAHLLQNRRPQDLRHQMQVAALTILQTGRHQAPQSAVEATFTRMVTESQKPINPRLQPSDDTLPAFFFHTHHSAIEFSHRNLGEYLCAEEIAAQMQALTLPVQDTYGEFTFAIHSPINVAQYLYQLLGYGVLSVEIEDMVIERLRRIFERNPAQFSFNVLFERLYRFYRTYCRGRWLDEGIAHQCHTQLQALHNPLKILQIDAAVGLNVFLLLSAIAKQMREAHLGHRATQISFWPCGNPDLPSEFDAEALLTLIGRTVVLSPTAFWQRARHSLSQLQLRSACLNHALLAEANLWQTNLLAAELAGANLAGANLQQANLSWANLSGADLSGANLAGARLEGANLTGANLQRTNLTLANITHACLFQAQLDDQNHYFARKNGALFSLEEFQAYIQRLPRLKQAGSAQDKGSADSEPTVFLIESAEGEPMLPEEPMEDEDDETVIAETSSTLGEPLAFQEAPKVDSQYDDETALVENPQRSN